MGSIMSETVQRAYLYRFYPSHSQVEQLNKTFGCTRFLYNYFLEIKQGLWRESKKSLSYVDMAKELTKLKKSPETLWLNEVSTVCLQQSLRALDKAYQNFFAKRARYPKKKKKRWNQSCKYMKNGFRFKDGELYLAKQEAPLKIRWSRPLPQGAIPSSVTLKRDSCGRYYVSILVEEAISPLSPRKSIVGIDLGVETAVTTSEGEKIPNPRPLRELEQRLAKAQRKLSRKKLGSNNRNKQRRRVARLHAKIQDYRKDYYHKVSTRLINENQVVAVETLDVKSMLKKKKLSKSISDVGFGQLVSFLTYKAKWYGRQLLKVDQWFPSSKMCFCCKGIVKSISLSVRRWQCSGCGEQHDRDINAAKNVLWAALEYAAGRLDEASYRRAGGKVTPVECV
jgi:putative transposase